MEYQVDELLFKMSALCDGVSLPNKSSLYYTTDSDGTLAGGGHTGHGHTGHADDVMSSGGSNLNDKDLDQNSLTRLLHLQGIGTQIHEGDQTYRYVSTYILTNNIIKVTLLNIQERTTSEG